MPDVTVQEIDCCNICGGFQNIVRMKKVKFRSTKITICLECYNELDDGNVIKEEVFDECDLDK